MNSATDSGVAGKTLRPSRSHHSQNRFQSNMCARFVDSARDCLIVSRVVSEIRSSRDTGTDKEIFAAIGLGEIEGSALIGFVVATADVLSSVVVRLGPKLLLRVGPLYVTSIAEAI